jgi:gamma-glutamylcyclotransferase (GGCT)/AIG2-like uncharacterized protein YtfP
MQPTDPTTIDPPRAFVYGTLRPGFANHRRTVGRFNPTATPGALHGFRLLGAGHWFPYATIGDDVVQGEVLTFDPADWLAAREAMDWLEGFPSHYDRRVVEVQTAAGPVTAWVYFTTDERLTAGLEPVPGGDWSEHYLDRHYYGEGAAR